MHNTVQVHEKNTQKKKYNDDDDIIIIIINILTYIHTTYKKDNRKSHPKNKRINNIIIVKVKLVNKRPFFRD